MTDRLRGFLNRRAMAPRVVRTGRPHHDLRALFAAEQRHFPTPIVAKVQWGRWPSNPPTRSIRLGSCKLSDPPVIRVHPVLDHPEVPEWFVSFILFHEMLHIAIPPEPGPNRRRIHTPRFRAAERTHPDYARAMVWEREHVMSLIRRIRKRK